MENIIDKIFDTEDRTELIDKCVDYIIKEYIKVGGRVTEYEKDATTWFLESIYEREGKSGLSKTMKKWKPIAPKKSWAGYV